MGCYVDNNSTRDLSKFSFQNENMTIEYCIRYCQFFSLPYAGLQNSNYCYCDSTFGKYSIASSDYLCNTSCAGNSNQTCGGFLLNSLFSTIYGKCVQYIMWTI